MLQLCLTLVGCFKQTGNVTHGSTHLTDEVRERNVVSEDEVKLEWIQLLPGRQHKLHLLTTSDKQFNTNILPSCVCVCLCAIIWHIRIHVGFSLLLISFPLLSFIFRSVWENKAPISTCKNRSLNHIISYPSSVCIRRSVCMFTFRHCGILSALLCSSFLPMLTCLLYLFLTGYMYFFCVISAVLRGRLSLCTIVDCCSLSAWIKVHYY